MFDVIFFDRVKREYFILYAVSVFECHPEFYIVYSNSSPDPSVYSKLCYDLCDVRDHYAKVCEL